MKWIFGVCVCIEWIGWTVVKPMTAMITSFDCIFIRWNVEIEKQKTGSAIGEYKDTIEAQSVRLQTENVVKNLNETECSEWTKIQ